MATPRSAAIEQTLRMIDGSPAWNPQATLALETMPSSAASSPIRHRPSPSPRSLLTSVAGIADPVSARQVFRGVGVGETVEAAAPVRAGEHGDFQVFGAKVAIGSGERGGAGLDGGGEGHRVGPRLVQPSGDRLGITAEDTEAALVEHRAVVEDVEQLIASRALTDLGDEDL